MSELMDRICEQRAKEAVLANRYEIAKTLWVDGYDDLERISRITRLTTEQVKEAIGTQKA